MGATNYWCEKRSHNQQCPFCDKTGNFSYQDEDEQLPCPNDNTHNIKIIGSQVSGLIGNRLSSQQIKIDRKKRSSQHFEKDVLPKLGSVEQKHFAEKGYKNKG